MCLEKTKLKKRAKTAFAGGMNNDIHSFVNRLFIPFRAQAAKAEAAAGDSSGDDDDDEQVLIAE